MIIHWLSLLYITGNFEALEMLFDIISQFHEQHPNLNPSMVDSQGNTIFHLAAKAEYSKHALKAVEILCSRNVNPNLRNAEDKTALQCIMKRKREDRRVQYIKMATKNFPNVPPKRKDKPSIQNSDSKIKGTEEPQTESVGAEITPEESGSLPAKSSVVPPSSKASMGQTKEGCRQRIRDLIEHLDETEAEESLHLGEVAAAEARSKEGSNGPSSPIEEATSNKPTIEEAPAVATEAKKIVVEKKEDSEADDEVEEDIVQEIDANIFDGLAWEVDCTAEVWKVLKDRKVPFEMKQRSIQKVQKLATGEWRPSLRKPLKIHGSEKEGSQAGDIKLYEAKLSKGSRIIWELTIDFSPRRSETADRRLRIEESEEPRVKGGRIYSEIIRVWDIVLDHDHIHKSIDKICKSHKRGRECIIQKKLHGINKDASQPGNYVKLRLPKIYTEAEDAQPVLKQDPPLQDYFPPASSNETEYHIMKFYSFDSALVQNVLQNQDIKVDFPFRVTELEHAIINLQPKPPAPILLLGRSGTGKTTCCLYRLWTSFVR